MAVWIREATPKDAAALVEIYAPYVRETAVTFEYDVPSVAAFPGALSGCWKNFPIWSRKTTGRLSVTHMRARFIRARPINGARK